MATAELVVAFGAKLDGLEASLKRVNTRFDQLETSAKKTSDNISRDFSATQSSMDSMGATALSAGRLIAAFWASMQAFRVAKDAAFAIDDVNASIMRLTSLTGNGRLNAEGVFQNLRVVAAQTGQAVNDTAAQFQRFFVATASLGASQSQVEAFVKVLNQFAQISGAKPQESAAAITQLAQGLASGRLQGDELKSILENMPQLAQALAQSLNVSVGTLRQMGEEGKLTANEVFPGILRLAGQMNDRLAGIPLTMRQSWQVLSDTALNAIVEIDRRIGATSWLSRLLQNFAQIIDTATLSQVNVNDTTSPLETRIQAINRELRVANEQVQDLDRRIAGAGNQRGAANMRIQADEGSTNRLRETRDRVLSQMQGLNNQLTAFQEQADAQAASAAARRAREGLEARVRDDAARARTIAEGANPILKAERERSERLTALERSLSDRRTLAIVQGGNAVAEVEEFARTQRAAIQTQYEEDVRKAGATERADANAAAAERRRRENEELQSRRAIRRQINQIVDAGDSGMAGFTQQMEEWDASIDGVRSSFDLFVSGVADGSQNITILFNAVSRSAERAAESMVRAGESPQQAITALQDQLDELGRRLLLLGVPAEQVTSAINTAMDRSTDSIGRMGDKAQRTFNEIKVAAVTTFSKDLSNSIVEFATTGEGKFDEMAANFAKNIAKMILDLMIFRALVAGLGAAGFSIPGLGIPGRMAGGPVNQNRPYIVGEGGPELFVPGGGGTIIPNGDFGSGGDMMVNIYNNAPDTSVRAQETETPNGRRLEIFVEEVVRKGLVSGRFDNTFRGAFNLSRAGRI